MNKKIAALFDQYGMTVNDKFAHGSVKGYETNACVTSLNFDGAYPLHMHVSFYATDDQKRNIEAGLRNLALKFFRMQSTPYGLSFELNDMTFGGLVKKLPEKLDKIYGVLSENGALGDGYCPVCGNRIDPESSKKCNIDGFTITMEADCVNKINATIAAENKEFDEAPNNYLKGFLGALIGGLVGVGIAVILCYIGVISSISAFVAMILGAFLYEKFHGKPNKMMIVIVSLTSLVLMVASIPIAYIIVAGIKFHNAGLSMSAFSAFQLAMQSAEISQSFYLDLALTFVFTAVAVVLEIFILKKKIQRQKTI